MDFETIKKNYDQKLWNIQLVKMAVRKGIITKKEYMSITNKEYGE